ncbi:MAG TPA: GNAT family N-acetyltransferase [Levilinea sp.]|nr:GNAT family N-acetyltransferase [Levilinea sp.]
MLNIRPAQPEDAAEIARLNLLFNEVEAPPEQYAVRLADARRVDLPILAEVDGRVVGLANLRLAPSLFYLEPYAELSELFVEETYRHQGIGQALVQYAENIAREAGADEIIILTGFYNDIAQRLYFFQGYKILDLALSKNLKGGS